MKKEILINKLDEWLKEQFLSELSENTRNVYKQSINKFINYLNNKKISDIDKDVMIKYKSYLDEVSKSINSKNLWIVSLNKYLKWLGYKDLCLRQFKYQKKYFSINAMTHADFKRFLRKAKELNMFQDYYIIKILGMTGIRISELKYFTVENLAKKNKNIIKIKNKGKERDVIIPNSLARDLRKYCRSQKIKSGTIFPSPKIMDKMITEKTINIHLKKIAGAGRISLKLAHAHAFRDYFAISFLEKYPENFMFLADLMGHSSLETTRIYTRLTTEEKQKLISKIHP